MSLALLLASASSFAHYQCTEKDSTLTVTIYRANHVIYKPKQGQAVWFQAKSLPSLPSSYFQIQNFDLKTVNGDKATLKISTIPVMSRVPPCQGRRVCDGFAPKHDISAELDYLGKVTLYDCVETF